MNARPPSGLGTVQQAKAWTKSTWCRTSCAMPMAMIATACPPQPTTYRHPPTTDWCLHTSTIQGCRGPLPAQGWRRTAQPPAWHTTKFTMLHSTTAHLEDVQKPAVLHQLGVDVVQLRDADGSRLAHVRVIVLQTTGNTTGVHTTTCIALLDVLGRDNS